MLKFGDIVKFGEDYYVFLASKGTEGVYYFAKIISDQDTIKSLLSRRDNFKDRHHNPAVDNRKVMLLCFTILTTEDFNDCLAFWGKPDSNDIDILNNNCLIVGQLNRGDINALKNDILSNQDVLPKALINRIHDLFNS